MQLIHCDIYDAKESELPRWKGILAYIETNGDSDSMKEWIGHIPLVKSTEPLEEKNLLGNKYLRINDGRCGEIILTSIVVEPSGDLIIEFEGVGLFDGAERESCFL